MKIGTDNHDDDDDDDDDDDEDDDDDDDLVFSHFHQGDFTMKACFIPLLIAHLSPDARKL